MSLEISLKTIQNPEVIKAQAEFDQALSSGKSDKIKKAATKLSDTKQRVELAWISSEEYKNEVKEARRKLVQGFKDLVSDVNYTLWLERNLKN